MDPVTEFSSSCNAFLAFRKISIVLERTFFSEVCRLRHFSKALTKPATEEQTTRRASHVTWCRLPAFSRKKNRWQCCSPASGRFTIWHHRVRHCITRYDIESPGTTLHWRSLDITLICHRIWKLTTSEAYDSEGHRLSWDWENSKCVYNNER